MGDRIHWTVQKERWYWFQCPECLHVWGEQQPDPGRTWCCDCGTSNSYPAAIQEVPRIDGEA